jgi:hypothetical protein
MLRGPRIVYGYVSGMASMYNGWIREEFIFEVKYVIMKGDATLELCNENHTLVCNTCWVKTILVKTC